MKRIITGMLLLLLCLALSACETHAPFEDVPDPIATITMEDGRVMRFKLDVQAAPNTVANFVELAQQHYYDGCEFIRIIPGALIQTGAKGNDLRDRADYTIQGEFPANRIENPLTHSRGAIVMCRTEDDYDSASTQFFILQGNFPEYDGRYAPFGMALDEETLETIDYIADVVTDVSYKPVSRIDKIRSVTVDTKDYVYTAAKIEDSKKDK